MESWLDMALKYVVLPLGAFVYGLHMRVNGHATEIAVMRAEMQAAERARQTSEAKIEKALDGITAKLDSIEAALRK